MVSKDEKEKAEQMGHPKDVSSGDDSGHTPGSSPDAGTATQSEKSGAKGRVAQSDTPQPESYPVAEAMEREGSPYAQKAGLARQIANELHLLGLRDAGDSERARGLRKDLEGMGYGSDEVKRAIAEGSEHPTGRTSRPERMTETGDASARARPASGGGGVGPGSVKRP